MWRDLLTNYDGCCHARHVSRVTAARINTSSASLPRRTSPGARSWSRLSAGAQLTPAGMWWCHDNVRCPAAAWHLNYFLSSHHASLPSSSRASNARIAQKCFEFSTSLWMLKNAVKKYIFARQWMCSGSKLTEDEYLRNNLLIASLACWSWFTREAIPAQSATSHSPESCKLKGGRCSFLKGLTNDNFLGPS